jgi:hypothetical protein
MSPHRTELSSTFAVAFASPRAMFATPPDSAAVAVAGLTAAVGWAVGAQNVPLIYVTVFAMVLDLIAGALGAVIDPLREFSIAQLYGGLLGKIFRFLLLPTAALADWLIILSPVPGGEAVQATFPVTMLALIGLAAGELTSVLNKFQGKGIAPALISAIMRHLDRVREGGEVPMRRHYDAPAVAVERGIDNPDEERGP